MDDKTSELLSTISIIQNLAQDIEDVIRDTDITPQAKVLRTLDLAELIQKHTAEVLPG